MRGFADHEYVACLPQMQANIVNLADNPRKYLGEALFSSHSDDYSWPAECGGDGAFYRPKPCVGAITVQNALNHAMVRIARRLKAER
ncbi:hypothetical protein FHW37_102211 [Neorhizobium alkalisoli]|uniref:Uncharacterized protein n=1 Tax=Neorhizobium alkalisoli TaxID=528178 RepID=A0A561R1T4_9HYPH|nr:hypothetical protein FHW37_102211 [Neorhizobium alkalisoli]